MKILITGGAGFIGSALVRHIIAETPFSIINVDKLTYAGNLDSLSDVALNQKYIFEQADICDLVQISKIFMKHKPNVIMHLAAESHVDRSIEGPYEFISTNIIGTYNLLESSRIYFESLNQISKRFTSPHAKLIKWSVFLTQVSHMIK